jgi:NAD(P)-dependent dehydrogenase (short-subunit alcohol dehydrogenase family)
VKLTGRTAIVTGAGRGIFRAVAGALAAAGAAVVIVDNGTAMTGEGSDRTVADGAAAEVRAAGGDAIACSESVATMAGAQAIVAVALEAFGRVDVLVNGAGIIRQNMVWDMSEDEFDKVVTVHLKGTWNTMRAVVPHMIERGSGSIVNTASGVGLFGRVASTNYAAAKAGIIGLTRAAAVDLGPMGVRVNAVCPVGLTRMIDHVEPWRHRYPTLHNQLPSPDQFPPEAVAPLYVYLATDVAQDVNGQVFDSGGGRVAWYAPPDHAGTTSIVNAGGPVFDVDELARRVPTELLVGYANPAPRQAGPDRVWPN